MKSLYDPYCFSIVESLFYQEPVYIHGYLDPQLKQDGKLLYKCAKVQLTNILFFIALPKVIAFPSIAIGIVIAFLALRGDSVIILVTFSLTPVRV